MEEKIDELFEEMDDRELAKELEKPVEAVQKMREDLGFLRLDSFSASDDPDSSIDVSFKLDEMRKRQLQGFVGEKITSLMENRVMEFLDGHVRSDWTLRSKAQIIRESQDAHRYWIGGRPERGEIRIDGSTVKHHGADDQEIRDRIVERCVVAEEEIFEKFQQVRNPWIDFSFHALKVNGSTEKSFQVRDFSSSSLEESDRIEVELPVIEDFKVIALEVKTTKDDEERLLSENQRSVRDDAQRSPFIDFFTLKVDTEFDELDIPSEFDAELKKHSGSDSKD